ncbi:MAG: hypothetical protein GY866_34475, partial [Proteobacteria bacterium]|nr:hypothetical protein [Pseudomonadota bacterium]
QVPRTLAWDFQIQELVGRDLSKVSIATGGGVELKLAPTSYSGKYTVNFSGVSPTSVVDLLVWFENEAAEAVEVETQPDPEPVAEPVPVKQDKKGWLQGPLKKQAERIEVRRKRIREAEALLPKDLANKKVLTFDQPCSWARLLGMIQKAHQLESQIGIPLWRYYNRITGQGYGAIVAGAIAGKIPLDTLIEWCVTDWKKVHNPNKLQEAQRAVVKFFKPSESGFDAKAARKSLKRLFGRAGASIRMKDVGTQLHITIIQADLLVSTHKSEEHPDMALWEIVEDSAVTKMDFNAKETIKGEAIFLGSVEKNDVMAMAVSPSNENLQITSIGTPVRVHPQTARKLKKLGHGGDKVAYRDATHFVYDERVEQVIAKLTAANYKIEYLRLECSPIDNTILTSTTEAAQNAGIDSGSGHIELPGWFLASIRRQIAS